MIRTTSRSFYTQARSFIRKYTRGTINILGIETSCDDTGVAIINNHKQIVAETLVTHSQIVAQWGGVFPPEIGKAHQRTLQGALDRTLSLASIDKSEISAVAVTNGPGLQPCLRAGIQIAQRVAEELQVPIIPIHHLEAHILLVRGLNHNPPSFPFLVLLVSGGHCMIVKAVAIGKYEIMGETQDDSIGEAYDKVARLLNIDVSAKSGGPELETLIRMYGGDPLRYNFPIPLMKSDRRKELAFSFSGLKSAVLWQVRKLEYADQNLKGRELGEIAMKEKNRMHNPDVRLPMRVVADIAASFQHTAISHLLAKTKLALQICKEQGEDVKDLVLCGGVAANQQLRTGIQTLCEKHDFTLHVPPRKYCTDNGVMIAWAGLERFQANQIEPNVQVRGRWPLDEL